MKGTEIINHIVRAKMPDREQVKENLLRQSIPEKQNTIRPVYRRLAVTLAAAAVLVFCFLFGNMLMTPQSGNLFSITAYAVEQQADGSDELRKVDLIEQTPVWGGYEDGEYFYLNVGLKCEGENLKSVAFSTNDGFFVKQYYKMMKLAVSPYTFIGPDGSIVDVDVYGDMTIALFTDLEKVNVGSKLMLDPDTMTEDFFLLLGMENTEARQGSGQITIHGIATFHDGKQQEETLVIDYIYP